MFSHPPTNYRNCQLQQRLEIGGFFLIAHTQLAVIVHPGMRSLHHPATRTPFAFVSGLRHSFLGHMWDIAPLPDLFFSGLAGVALIHAQILGSALRRLRPWHHDRVQRLSQQLHVVPIGPGDDKRERGATAVHQQTALGPFFFPGLSGYFRPPLGPVGLCPASRPGSPTPKQSLPSRHTLPDRLATTEQKIPPAATVGNGYGWRWRCQTLWATPSTDTPCATHTRWRRKYHAARYACGPHRVAAGICVAVRLEDCALATALRPSTTGDRTLPRIGLSTWHKHTRK